MHGYGVLLTFTYVKTTEGLLKEPSSKDKLVIYVFHLLNTLSLPAEVAPIMLLLKQGGLLWDKEGLCFMYCLA